MNDVVTVCKGASGRGRSGDATRALRGMLAALLVAGLAAPAAGCRGSEQKPPTAGATENAGGARPGAAGPQEGGSPTATIHDIPGIARTSPETPEAAPEAGPCARVDFPAALPIAEASGGVVTTIDGVTTLMVIADSGHGGDYLLVDPQSGAVRERGRLPLGKKGDDLEGLAVRGDRIWAITSSGWLRAWTRRTEKPAGFDLVAGPLPITPVDAPSATAMTCELRRANCGRNFEGLCLAPTAVAGAGADDCVGMAASKAEGRLYCIVERDGSLAIDPERTLSLGKPEALADCNIDGDTLWAGANLFQVNRVWRVTGWRTPERAQVVELGTMGVGFCEGIAAAGDTLFRLSDMQGESSLVSKFRCSPPTK